MEIAETPYLNKIWGHVCCRCICMDFFTGIATRSSPLLDGAICEDYVLTRLIESCMIQKQWQYSISNFACREVV